MNEPHVSSRFTGVPIIVAAVGAVRRHQVVEATDVRLTDFIKSSSFIFNADNRKLVSFTTITSCYLWPCFKTRKMRWRFVQYAAQTVCVLQVLTGKVFHFYFDHNIRRPFRTRVAAWKADVCLHSAEKG